MSTNRRTAPAGAAVAGMTALALLAASGCGVLDRRDPPTVTVTQAAPGVSRPTPPPSAGTPPQSPATRDATSEHSLDTQQLAASWAPSVVRFEVAPCNGSGWTGSGFVVGDNLVMTAAHIVDGAGAITVRGGTHVVSATVVGVDDANDAALVRTATPIAAAPLPIETARPSLGLPVAVLGYPLGTYDVHLTQGVLSALDEKIDPEGPVAVQHALVTDTAINFGNSGGPALDAAGRVVGLVSAVDRGAAATGFLSPADVLRDDLARWRTAEPQKGPSCGGTAFETPHPLEVDVTTNDPLGYLVAQSLAVYATAISEGSYDAAWAVVSPGFRKKLGSLSEWSKGLTTSSWARITVEDASTSTSDRVQADVAFRTYQAPQDGPDGSGCTDWHVRYTMLVTRDGLLIDGAKRIDPPISCD